MRRILIIRQNAAGILVEEALICLRSQAEVQVVIRELDAESWDDDEVLDQIADSDGVHTW